MVLVKTPAIVARRMARTVTASPPAKARRSTSTTFTALHRDSAPPPPYAPPLEKMILDSHVTVTTDLMAASGSTEGIGPPNTPGIEDWMNEKSREELSDLLLAAGSMIKERETGTSSIFRRISL